MESQVKLAKSQGLKFGRDSDLNLKVNKVKSDTAEILKRFLIVGFSGIKCQNFFSETSH